MDGLTIFLLIQVFLFLAGTVLDWRRPASQKTTYRWACACWCLALLATLAVVSIRFLADASTLAKLNGWNAAADAWTAVACLTVLLAIAVGFVADSDPVELLLAGGAAGFASGNFPISLRLVALFALLWVKTKDRRTSLLDRRDARLRLVVLAGGLAVAGLLLLGSPMGPVSVRWRELAGCILLVSGLGGLVGWFPFPAVRRVAYSVPDLKENTEKSASPSRESATDRTLHATEVVRSQVWKTALSGEYRRASVGQVVPRVLLPFLAVASLLVRELGRLQTESSLAVLVVAIILPAVFAGARLLREDHLADRLALQTSILLGSVIASVPLFLWQRTREADTAGLNLWAALNLPDAAMLLRTGAAAEFGSWLVLACGTVLLTSTAAGDQFVSGLHGALRRDARRSVWLVIGLWIVAGLPPSPCFWWRMKLLASLMVAHRRSSLTNLFEPAPVFWVLSAGVLIAWTLAAIGWLKLLGGMIWEEPLSTTRRAGRSWGQWTAWLAAMLLACAGSFFDWQDALESVRLAAPQNRYDFSELTERRPFLFDRATGGS